MTRPLALWIVRLRAWIAPPVPTAHLPALNVRTLALVGGIVGCRDAPLYVADRRSLKAGVVLWFAVLVVVGLITVVSVAVMGGKG